MYPHYEHSNGPPPPNITQYLLGVGPLPPPTPQQQAVAQMNQVLDSGAFDGTQSHPAQQSLQRHSNIQRLGGPKSKRVYVTIRINAATIEPQDFLARVHANMELKSEEDIELGWRVSDAPLNKGFRRLKTNADVHGAFDEILNRNKDSRRVTPLSMVIKNITPNVEKEVFEKPLKTTDTSYGDELTKLKEKLRCMQHSGHNRWCFVRRDEDHAGQHVNLGIEEITLWARKWRDGESDGPLHPPSVLNLNNLVEKQATRQARSIKRNQGPSGQLIHIHLDSSLRDTAKSSSNTPTKHKRDEEESDDDDIVVGIRDVLDDLHAKKPGLEYHQYESALRRKGIAYADAVSNFPDVFFVEEIHMAEGAVKGFKQAAKRAAKGKMGQKQPRFDYEKENADIV
ncbi:hypothetical protein F5051DRAFT_334075 [Lentinula edodes]|nr:hypothetical protein F5051DRAFT_334075 [Lentinula edodes]